MFYVLKGLLIERKINAYEKTIIALQSSRDKLKTKQAKATVGREKYQELLKQHKSEG